MSSSVKWAETPWLKVIRPVSVGQAVFPLGTMLIVSAHKGDSQADPYLYLNTLQGIVFPRDLLGQMTCDFSLPFKLAVTTQLKFDVTAQPLMPHKKGWMGGCVTVRRCNGGKIRLESSFQSFHTHQIDHEEPAAMSYLLPSEIVFFRTLLGEDIDGKVFFQLRAHSCRFSDCMAIKLDKLLQATPWSFSGRFSRAMAYKLPVPSLMNFYGGVSDRIFTNQQALSMSMNHDANQLRALGGAQAPSSIGFQHLDPGEQLHMITPEIALDLQAMHGISSTAALARHGISLNDALASRSDDAADALAGAVAAMQPAQPLDLTQPPRNWRNTLPPGWASGEAGPVTPGTMIPETPQSFAAGHSSTAFNDETSLDRAAPHGTITATLQMTNGTASLGFDMVPQQMGSGRESLAATGPSFVIQPADKPIELSVEERLEQATNKVLGSQKQAEPIIDANKDIFE